MIQGWCLDTGATHHMIGRREFIELDSSVRGSVKFGDASGIEVKGADSVVFTTAFVSTCCSPESTTSLR
jgi:hypothetical protein